MEMSIHDGFMYLRDCIHGQGFAIISKGPNACHIRGETKVQITYINFFFRPFSADDIGHLVTLLNHCGYSLVQFRWLERLLEYFSMRHPIFVWNIHDGSRPKPTRCPVVPSAPVEYHQVINQNGFDVIWVAGDYPRSWSHPKHEAVAVLSVAICN